MSNQEVPLGYKQTKVGVIPVEWNFIQLQELTTQKITDGTHKTPTYTEKGILFLSARNIKDNKLNFKNIKYITIVEHTQLIKRCNPEVDDILLTKSGSLGDSIVVPNLGFSFSIFESLALIKINKNKCIPHYLSHYLNSYYSQKIFHSITTGLAVKHLHLIDLKKMRVPLPQIKEQEKIANILTTWDDVISKQDELIKAKEELKKGLMQKLLSGEIRFAGFFDEWEDTKLGKYITEISTKNKDKKVSLVLTVSTKHGFISQLDYFDREIASKDTSNYKIVQKGNFAYNPSRINIGSISHLSIFKEGILSPMYVIFKCNNNLDSNYFSYWLDTHNFNGNLYKYLSGSVRDSLSFKDMKLMKIKLPPLQEQQKIAEILSNADKEIGLLKNELQELKEQKKGLMQKLLTGEIRCK